ncbi:hypothetical protein PRZ48_004251 [Zasmidium cellare]|uniref:Uncharacterized protein n=1 Tax=Zasmidium cellare TaxID=395010 RepID=A0ABR0EQ05_ZASCE|nr:hypothetical protein PRZ48_004251 [Zasmidium cellare]
MAKLRYIAASLALGTSLVQAQGPCNPLKTSCPPLPGFTQGFTNDFTERPNIPSDWIIADYADHLLSFGENGLEFRLTKGTDAPYIWTKNYLHYGKVEVTLQSAPGIGVVSSAVLMSDTHDEIDWEWSGNDFAYNVPTIQTNYFGKGVTGNWDRGTQPQVGKNMSQNIMTYTIDWKPESITWSIDGSIIRTHYAKDSDNDQYQYPQSPSRFHLGVWDAGNEGNAWYTVQWAGGHTDLTKFPYSMFVKSVSITPYKSCGQYNYTDTSGSSDSIDCFNISSSLNSTLPGSGTGTGTLPTRTGGPSHTCSAAAPENTQPGTSAGCAKYYTVKSGDSCDSIAKAAGIDVDDLLDWNPQADDKCWNLWANYAICVSPPGHCDASGKPIPQTTADGLSLTTATIKYTSTITVLKCASTITNCPAASKTVPVVSTTVTQFTTVCPVSEVESISSVAAGGDLPVGATPLPGGEAPSYATPTAIPTEDVDEVPEPPPAYEDDEDVPPPGLTTKVMTTVYTTICPEESTITTHGSVVTSTGSKLTTSTITSTITKTLPIESVGTTLPPGYTTSDVTTVYTTICPVESTITTQGTTSSYEITCDADYVGGDLKYIDCGADKNPKEACAKECAKTAGCKGFSVVGYHCYLKKTLYPLKKYGGCVAGKLVEGPLYAASIDDVHQLKFFYVGLFLFLQYQAVRNEEHHANPAFL